MFFTSPGHSSTSPSLYPTNNAVEYMLDAQMPHWDGKILVMCSTEDVHDFQNLNKHEKLMAQSCVAWYMLCATVHGPANNSLNHPGKKASTAAPAAALNMVVLACSLVRIVLPAADNGPAVQVTAGMPRSPPGEAATAATDAAQTAANTSTSTVVSGYGSATANNNKNSVLQKHKFWAQICGVVVASKTSPYAQTIACMHKKGFGNGPNGQGLDTWFTW
ncbi:hypothetical protein B0H17DRAFT_1128228 [Mycena rosella]|uniref:Uncharacterized protein n=1 Tax=Mycena rosella TaxID=1033263 RepID=A0AAD7DYT0_MYCRO|nr:hypothetical protein B0H17DRAFT_1128228 [Mycena rosella]